MKARLLAVLLVSALVLASTGPVVLAQEAGEEGRDDGNANITIVDCSQVQNAFSVSQGQYGNANAVAQYQGDAVAVVSQEMNISQSQVNACLIGNPGDNTTPDSDDDTDNGANTGNDDSDDQNDVMANTIPKTAELPNTGGPSLLAVGVGLALVAGGASLIRFRR